MNKYGVGVSENYTKDYMFDIPATIETRLMMTETIAATLSQNLSQYFEVSLWYCFEKQGVLNNIDDDSSVIETITPQVYDNLKAGNIIHSGMIPKIDNCFDALAHGVSKVKIGAPKMITGITQHTTLTLKDE